MHPSLCFQFASLWTHFFCKLGHNIPEVGHIIWFHHQCNGLSLTYLHHSSEHIGVVVTCSKGCYGHCLYWETKCRKRLWHWDMGKVGTQTLFCRELYLINTRTTHYIYFRVVHLCLLEGLHKSWTHFGCVCETCIEEHLEHVAVHWWWGDWGSGPPLFCAPDWPGPRTGNRTGSRPMGEYVGVECSVSACVCITHRAKITYWTGSTGYDRTHMVTHCPYKPNIKIQYVLGTTHVHMVTIPPLWARSVSLAAYLPGSP